MYDAKKETLKRELRGHSVCLTTDTWTSCQNINYMVVTAHFIDSGWNMHKRVLNFCVVPNHTGNTIGKILESCLINWNLDRVLTISVDNASVNKVSIEYLQKKMSGWPRKPLFDGKFMHVRCLAHIVNIIVRSSLHIMDRSVASIRNAVRYVRSSGQRLDVIKLCAEKEILDCSKVCVLDVPTRWNSTFIMLDTALELKKAFDRMADVEDAKYRSYFDEEDDLDEELNEAENIKAARHSRKMVGPPVESNWEKAAVFVKFLNVFYDVTVEVSAQLKPTTNKVFHDIVTIREELDHLFHKPIDNQSTESDKILFGMTDKMRNKFKKYFGSIEDINQLFFAALVLDPRYKLKNVKRVCEMYLAMDSVEIKKKSDELKQLVLTLCDI
ncbi:putative ribonuclease H-like domain, hAT-like transposase, RNase-H [Rosa chinensis]|uniref:Putative ribonuclease H-like domain, hAT-like transposase, RNase-H n=1 Tax=Rosa chinensis TaxID=74649 RepID=A0A2P6PGN0_ROSCH|nr:putative ribonuclease H-like domain, hAT-like transposase, RNase-H [Rosa chinensis]